MRALRAAAAAAALLGLAAGLLGQPARAFDETLILRVGTLVLQLRLLRLSDSLSTAAVREIGDVGGGVVWRALGLGA